MRVGILSYPMLFQCDGSLQEQVRGTIRALNAGALHAQERLQVELVDPYRARLDDYDLIHVFGAGGGNHHMVEAASGMGVPVVLSPLVPSGRHGGMRARVAGHVLARLPALQAQSAYTQCKRALQLAALVLAHSDAESRAIVAGFHVDPVRLRTLPQGIDAHFFVATAQLFQAGCTSAAPFALLAGPGQRAVAEQALAELALPLVAPGGTCPLHHDDRLLASAYAAAALLLVDPAGGILPALEALACGTPVVMLGASCLELRNSACAVRTVRQGDIGAIKRAAMAFLADPPPRETVRALVRGQAWERIAADLAACYAQAVSTQRRLAVSSSAL